MNLSRLAAVAATVSISLGGASAAVAASPNHSEPGTPGAKNCFGQTMAYLAQLDLGVPGEHPGIGGISDVTGLTNAEIRDLVTVYCNTV